jgi:hypothetical protein
MVSGSLRVALLLRYDQVARSSSKTEFYDQTLDPRRKSKIYDQARPPKPIYHNWVFLTLVSDYFFWIYIVALLNKVTILEVLVRQDQYCFGLCFVLDGPGSHHPSSKMWISRVTDSHHRSARLLHSLQLIDGVRRLFALKKRIKRPSPRTAANCHLMELFCQTKNP